MALNKFLNSFKFSVGLGVTHTGFKNVEMAFYRSLYGILILPQ